MHEKGTQTVARRVPELLRTLPKGHPGSVKLAINASCANAVGEAVAVRPLYTYTVPWTI